MPLDTGQKISGVMHIGLILWVMVGDLFRAPDTGMRVPVTDVALISAEEFAALQAPARSPDPAPQPAPQPTPAPAPDPVPEPAPEPEIAAPPPLEQEPPLAAPAPEPPPAPQPEPEPQPQPEPAAPAMPETGVVFSPLPAPGSSVRPRPRPVDRVAPTPSEAPDPEARIDIAESEAITPDAEREAEVVEPEAQATALPEATTEIVTEATETDRESLDLAARAPEVSPRPQRRPERPQPRPEPEPQPQPQREPAQTAERPAPTPQPAPDPAPEPAPEPEAPRDAIADALAEALAGGATDPGPARPATGGLSQSEADGLRLAVQQCWNLGALSTEAMGVTVVVGVSMTPNAMPEMGSIRMISASGGGESATSQAFEAARRAILRCAGDGYGLPPEKYDHWRDIEITFNPEGMRIR